jgi:hypothetical protein
MLLHINNSIDYNVLPIVNLPRFCRLPGKVVVVVVSQPVTGLIATRLAILSPSHNHTIQNIKLEVGY